MNHFPSVSPAHVHHMMRTGAKVEIIDVRTPSEYRSGHIDGAQLLPLDEIQPGKLAALTENSDKAPDSTLYITCQSGARAQQAAERLAATSEHKITLIEGGTQAWDQAGLPMKRCGDTISLERQVQIAIGSLIVLKVIFGFTVHELFFVLSALIGSGLIVAGITRWCGMARLIAKMPWNQRGDCPQEAAA